jgi:hypothetical protein
MSLLTHAPTWRPVDEAPETQSRPSTAIPAAAAQPAAWVRFAKVALTLLAFVVVVTAIVVLKSLVWIPHFNP